MFNFFLPGHVVPATKLAKLPRLSLHGTIMEELSGGIRVRIPQELESRCRGFLSSEKMPWNHDVVACLSPFLDVVVFWFWNLDVMAFWSWNLDVVAFWSWNLDVVVFWSWNLDVVVFWSWNLNVVIMCLHGLVFVIMVKTKKPRIIMSIMLLKNISTFFKRHVSIIL